MDVTFFLSLLGFLWLAAITPGPNNTLLAASGASYGFGRSLPLMAGIVLGVQCVLLLSAFGIGSLILLYPALHVFLKLAGSLYLLWLAWKIGTARYQQVATDTSLPAPVGFWQGSLFQLINPKAWFMTLGAVASFHLPQAAYLHSILAISLGIILVTCSAAMIWMIFGGLIGKFLRSQKAWTAFNGAMGLLTAACVLLIWR